MVERVEKVAAVEEREAVVGEEEGVAAAGLATEDAERGVFVRLQWEDGGGRGEREEGAPSFGGEATLG